MLWKRSVSVCILYALLLSHRSVLGADKSTKDSNTWSFSLGSVHLFDIPKFGGSFSLFGGSESNERSANSVEDNNYSNEITIDPDIVEDSLLKTVGVYSDKNVLFYLV